MEIELGLDTFGDVTRGADGKPVSDAQAIRDVVAQAKLADEVGLQFFGVGEHHRPEFAVSSPEIVLAAIASVKRAALENADVYPKTANGLTAWVGVGGSPESVVRTARHGLGLMLAIIGGSPARFRPYVDLFHRSLDSYEKPIAPVGVHSPGHVAETDEQAWDELYPDLAQQREKIGRERGWPGTYNRLQFQSEVGPEGAVYAGSPERVAQKIASTVRTLGLSRFDLKFSNGGLEQDKLLKSIELYGTQVAPRVRELLADE